MATLTDYISELDDLAGLDLEEDEAERLINEARRKLLTESEWRRANVEVGPTVADQETYDAPAGLYRILKLKVDGYPCFPIDEQTIDKLKTDPEWSYGLPSGAAFYYLTHSSAAAELIGIYPAPSEAGNAIVATIVKEPSDIPSTGEDPDVPTGSQWAIRHYVAAVSYALSEDLKDLADSHRSEFDRAVEELRSLRNKRSRRGPMQARVVGYSTSLG